MLIIKGKWGVALVDIPNRTIRFEGIGVGGSENEVIRYNLVSLDSMLQEVRFLLEKAEEVIRPA